MKNKSAKEKTKTEHREKLMATATITEWLSIYLQEMLSITKQMGVVEKILLHK